MARRDTVVSFMPDGNYEDNAACSWLIDCATGQANPRPPVVRMEIPPGGAAAGG